MAHHMRRSIIRFMADQDGPVSPTDVVTALKGQDRRITLPNVSYHFRLLSKAGALDLKEEIGIRGSLKHLYLVNPQFVAHPLIAAVIAGFLDLR